MTEVDTAAVVPRDRYVVHERIGIGSMGLVYRTFDRTLGRDVALKMLRERSPNDLYRLKHEFRALAGMSHPNLVALYDLVVAERGAFFTMELLDGTDLVGWVRGGAPPGTPLDADGVARLRAVLPELAAGLCALHTVGVSHRDLKPSNVMVTSEGRVVLLDFGLAASREQIVGTSDVRPAELVGTPDYMAPEQIRGDRASAAADCYSLGVLLYAALAGRLPFANPILRRTPPSPQSAAPDLDALALELLATDPRRRPTADEVRTRAGVPFDGYAPPSTATVWEAPFIGRDPELAALADAWAARRDGTVVLHVIGSSGIGKTALVRHFLDGLAASGALVLAGRCHPQETVPYEALDSLIDALCTWLLECDEPERWIPEGASALVRAFPVLGRVEAMCAAPTDGEAEQPQELRRQAFAALHGLLARLAAAHPVALWIDDLQWGDLDSELFLRGLTDAAGGGPPLLAVLTYRSEDRDTSPLLRALADDAPHADDGTHAVAALRTLHLAPLGADEARRLTAHLLPATAGDAHLEAVVAQAGGSPFLACELARYLATRVQSTNVPTDVVGLEDVIGARVAQLPNEARTLLEVLAIAGAPLDGTLAGDAAGVGSSWAPLAVVLRNTCLVRYGSTSGPALLEPYHDRIRESIVAGLLPEARRGHHRALARVLGAVPDPDPLALLMHHQGAGDLAEAARFAAIAADQAARTMAFNSAAQLYGVALELADADTARGPLLEARAAALANAGLGAEAGAVYADAAAAITREDGDHAHVTTLRRASAEQYLRSGCFADGLRGLREVLATVGVRYPESSVRAGAAVLYHRAALAFRRLHAQIDVGGTTTDVTARLDAYWAAAVGLVWVDPIRSADFQGRHTRLALRAREPYRLVRALATETAFLAALGGARRHRRAARALGAARAVAATLDHPPSTALTELCAGMATHFAGDFAGAIELLASAEHILRQRCVGIAWELANCHLTRVLALAYTGRLAELDSALPALVREAGDYGDRLATTGLTVSLANNLRLLARDLAGDARDAITEALAGWPEDRFLIPHYYALYSGTQTDLYAGDAVGAWERLERTWPTLLGTLILRFQLLRIDARALRGRTAIAAALAARGGNIGPSSPDELLRIATSEARRIAREDMPWCAPFAAIIDAGVASARKDDLRAATLLARAAAGFDAAGMHLMANVARRQRGILLGGGEGADLRGAAERWMTAAGVRSPDALARALVPLTA